MPVPALPTSKKTTSVLLSFFKLFRVTQLTVVAHTKQEQTPSQWRAVGWDESMSQWHACRERPNTGILLPSRVVGCLDPTLARLFQVPVNHTPVAIAAPTPARQRNRTTANATEQISSRHQTLRTENKKLSASRRQSFHNCTLFHSRWGQKYVRRLLLQSQVVQALVQKLTF